MDLKAFIRDVPDFPKAGIVFKDITPLVANAAALRESAARIAAHFRGRRPDVVVGVEARGFIVATAVALDLGVGLAPVRKAGKLPHETVRVSYDLEYGTDTVEMHRDAIARGQRVLVVDDLLATGGTVAACCQLVDELGGEIIACAFIIELDFLHGRERLQPHEVLSLIHYESE